MSSDRSIKREYDPENRSEVEEKPDEPETGTLVGPDSDVTPVVSVVMPTLNEEEGIEQCMRWIREAVVKLDLPTEVIISDSSTDRTPEIARDLGARVVTPDEEGYGYAYQYAFERVQGEYIVMGDADTTYDFREIPRFLSCITDGDADIVMGSRMDGEIKDGAMPALHQYVGNPALTRFLNLFYDVGVSDAHSGFRVFRKDVLNQLDLRSNGMEFASEMVMVAGAEGFDIEEVPITYHEREGEATLDSLDDGWRHLKFMLVNAPSYLFIVPGTLLMLLGGLLSSVAFLDIQVSGQGFGVHSLIYGSLLVVVGFQTASFGVLTDIAGDPIRNPEDPATRVIRDHFTLERGLFAGTTVLCTGGVVALYYLGRWFASGFTRLPIVSADVVAFTGVAVGVQLIFFSFFASTLADRVGDG